MALRRVGTDARFQTTQANEKKELREINGSVMGIGARHGHLRKAKAQKLLPSLAAELSGGSPGDPAALDFLKGEGANPFG
jgi:hypothetical protein